MNNKIKKLLALVLITTSIGVLGGCGNKGSNSKIVVGSKDFTESYLLSEIYALALEDNGFKVERKLKLGSSVVHNAIESGEIDMYPEYTGTGLTTILNQDPISDPQKVYDIVKKEYKEKYNIAWLEHSNVNDTEGVAITKNASDRLGGISTISDAWKHASDLKLAGNGEFMEREDALPLLKKVYGDTQFKGSSVVDHALSFQAALNGEADLIGVYTTEGSLDNDEFIVLKDDKQAFPPYYMTPIVRQQVLDANPKMEEVINKVTATFTDKNMIKLNARVDINKEEYEDVAEDYYNSIKDKIK